MVHEERGVIPAVNLSLAVSDSYLKQRIVRVDSCPDPEGTIKRQRLKIILHLKALELTFSLLKCNEN